MLRASGFIVFRKTSEQIIEFLLLKASYPPFHWTSPKGHVDPGENELETAYRETEEESGLRKTDLKIVDGFKEVLKYEANGKPKVVTYWLAELITNTDVVLSHEHTDFKWADSENTLKLVQFEDTKNMFKICNEFLNKNS